MTFATSTLAMAAATFVGFKLTREKQKRIATDRLKLKQSSETLAFYKVPHAGSRAREFLTFKRQHPEVPDDIVALRLRSEQLIAQN